MIRMGCGLDVHAFADGRQLILGGVHIPHERGLVGHSDADAVAHAICDALLGALALGDIGEHFPDSDPAYHNADSMVLLAQTANKVRQEKGEIVNVDASIALQHPRLSPHVAAMRRNMAMAMQVDVRQVSVKATTTEQLGFVGRQEGIAVFAVALVRLAD